MARDRQVLATGHHLGHADSRRGSALSGLAVGEQAASLDNRAEIGAVGDVIEPGALGHTHSEVIYPDSR